MTNGIEISQEGIPVDKAADYQKVLSSRWRFMEIERELDQTITVPSISVSNYSHQRFTIFKHGLNFIPAYEASFSYSTTPGLTSNYGGIYCDDKEVYYEREVFPAFPEPAVDIRLKSYIYNLPILERYRSPSEPIPRGNKADSRIGVRALDGSDSAVKIGDSSLTGFSIDTTKKIISVHKVDTKYINEWIFDTVRVTSVDTAANTFTFTSDPNGAPGNTGTGWVQTGVPVTFSPADFTTAPSPLSISSTYYVIKVSDTQFQLALSYAAAVAGVAIDITTTGSLPIRFSRGPIIEDDRVAHESGYPPSFLFSEYGFSPTSGKLAVEPLRNISTTPLVLADNNYLYFKGVQAVYASRIAYIVLKDPVEIAA